MAEQTVELQPGESKVITFPTVPIVAKSYSVSVDGLAGSFRAEALPIPTALRIDIVSAPATCKLYGPCGWAVTVTNISGTTVSYYFSEYTKDFLRYSRGPFTLAPGASKSHDHDFYFSTVYDRQVILYVSDRKLPQDRKDITPETVIYDVADFTIRGIA